MRVFRSMLLAAADASVRVRLGIAIAASLVLGAISGLAPYLLNLLIDALGDGAGAGAVYMMAGAYISAHAAARLTEQIQAYAFATGDQRLQQRLGAAGLARLLRLPLAIHIERQAGGLVQAQLLGLQGVRMWLTHIVFSLLPLTVQLGCIAGIAFGAFDAALASTLLGAIIAYGIVFSLDAARQARSSEEISSVTIEAGGYLLDALANVEAVKGLGAEDQVAARYAVLARACEASWRTLHARRSLTGLALIVVFTGALVLAMLQAIPAALAGKLSPGGLVLLASYLLQTIRPLEMTGLAVRDLGQGLVYIDGWSRVLGLPAEAYGEPAGLKAADASPPTICFSDVSFSYAGQARLLANISFEAPSGGFMAVIGASGVGKSTLIRLLLRHCAPESGAISLDGRPLAEMSIAAVRAQIAVVSQETVLFNASLADNLLLANPRADQTLLDAAIRLACLEDLVKRLPDGLASRVGERGQKLSGGERQRVALARAILKGAPVLLLDEPTSGLDAATERAVLDNLLRGDAGGRSNRTILLVTHRLEAAARADRILVLSEGRVEACGAHRDLLARGGVYAEMWTRNRGVGEQLREGDEQPGP
ncbi:MAG: ATP-binding cassette domain-containing protein [Hyphomonadaceae bacterium]